MKIVIIGAGFTGIQLAKRLINGKNDVVLIDNNEEIVRHASNRLDCDVILADGNNLATLEEAGLAKADALVCVTSSDEVNMITCSLVDSVYPNLLKIARVRNYAYYVNTADAAQKHAGDLSGNHRPLYGIDYMIHPDVEAAEAIVNAVEHGALTDSIPFGDDYELVRIQVEAGSPVDGQILQNIRTLTQKPILIAYIESAGETSLPSGSTIIKANDYLGILARKTDILDFLQLCGSKIKKLNKIALIGAGRIGTIVAERLIQRKRSVFARLFGLQKKVSQDFVIIDSDEAQTKAASERFPDVKVFRADATDEAFLREEGIDKFDLVICATHNHELNIIVAAYIESLGVKNSICLVASSAFAEIARKIEIEVAVPLRDTVVDSIMSHLRGSNVTGIHTVTDGTLEILEITISENSQVNEKMLKDIAENGKFLILMVQKPGEPNFTIPTGNTVLANGDNLVLITTTKDSQHVLEKFEAES
ncbi:MAG: Trk system potassium transporter TrkA [Treponema sp.]|nr:Trk system potassium transporter TrkA [Spirochaetaceae bacterium]MBQ6782109.1 Trk system potassium transporter TrkA [Treponema sp.]